MSSCTHPGKRLPILNPRPTLRQAPAKFAVLVQTTEFEHAGEVKHGVIQVPSIEGMVSRGVATLPKAEVEMLQQKYHFMDWENLFVLEKGRQPSSTTRILTIAGIGTAVLIAGFLARDNPAAEDV